MPPPPTPWPTTSALPPVSVRVAPFLMPPNASGTPLRRDPDVPLRPPECRSILLRRAAVPPLLPPPIADRRPRPRPVCERSNIALRSTPVPPRPPPEFCNPPPPAEPVRKAELSPTPTDCRLPGLLNCPPAPRTCPQAETPFKNRTTEHKVTTNMRHTNLFISYTQSNYTTPHAYLPVAIRQYASINSLLDCITTRQVQYIGRTWRPRAAAR